MWSCSVIAHSIQATVVGFGSTFVYIWRQKTTGLRCILLIEVRYSFKRAIVLSRFNCYVIVQYFVLKSFPYELFRNWWRPWDRNVFSKIFSCINFSSFFNQFFYDLIHIYTSPTIILREKLGPLKLTFFIVNDFIYKLV